MAKAPYSASAQALPHRMSRLFTEIRWILQVALGVFLLMALVSYNRRDPSWTHAAQVDHIGNWAGRVGAWTSDILLLLFGLSAYWWIVLLGRHISANYKRITRSEEPEEDTPRALKEYAEMHRIKAGWSLLTGKPADVERLRRTLGFTNLDPVLDQDKTQHIGNIRYGSEPLMQWTAIPGMTKPESIAKAIARDFPSGRN